MICIREIRNASVWNNDVIRGLGLTLTHPERVGRHPRYKSLTFLAVRWFTNIRGFLHIQASTMLQQILRDMFIDPELLAELDEDQKQVLFCKMREEQIRRWTEREEKLEQDEKKRPKKPKKPGGRSLDFLLGKDGNPWTWVMGEHENDRTIEQIMEEEAQKQAHLLAETEAEELRKAQEAEIARKLAEDEERVKLEAKKKQEEEELKKKELSEKSPEDQKYIKLKRVKERHELRRRQSINDVEQLKRRRSMEIYMSYKESRNTFEKQAQEGAQKIEEEWEEHEKKAKKHEEEVRAIARRAREEHRRSMTQNLRTNAHLIGVLAQGLKEQRGSKEYPSIPAKPATHVVLKSRPPKPPNHQAIVEWFRYTERGRGSGLEPATNQVAPWFHGIITRQAAEDLLEEKTVGTFLVRVSERIWGYAISYRADNRCKHFLIDTSDGTYQFFGTNQLSHSSLADLVSHHKIKPISSVGQELLLYPCPQVSNPPNYEALFQGADTESSYL